MFFKKTSKHTHTKNAHNITETFFFHSLSSPKVAKELSFPIILKSCT